MAHFDILTAFPSGQIPRLGFTDYHGPQTVGVAAMLRNLVQFMNGCAVVDYSSLVVSNGIGGAPTGTGRVAMFDVRYGHQFGVPTTGTSGFTPHVPQTWTGEFTSDTQYTMTGSVSGFRGTYDVDVNAGELDLWSAYIISGDTDWVVGDQFVITTVTNPNNSVSSPNTQWTDPDCHRGQIDSAVGSGDLPTRDTRGQSLSLAGSFNYNLRAMFIDSGGSGFAEDFVYMNLSEVYHPGGSVYSLMAFSMTGYTPDGTHINSGPPVYNNMDIAGGISGHFMCDQFGIRVPYIYDGEWDFFRVSLLDSYLTQPEFPYPMMYNGNTGGNGGIGPVIPTHANNKGYLQPGGKNHVCMAQDGTWFNTQWAPGTLNSGPIMAPLVFHPLPNGGTGSQYTGCNGNTYTFWNMVTPPRPGNAQVPIIPVAVSSAGDVSANSATFGDLGNGLTGSRWYGEERGIFAVSQRNVAEGDLVQIAGVDYLCIQTRHPFATINTVKIAVRLT